MAPRKLRPAALGGAFIGALSALPVVSVGNVCCCLWLVVGGGLAAWLMQQSHPEPVTPADGAAVGFLAGVIGAGVFLVISWPLTMVMGPMFEEWLEQALENAGDVPLRDVLEQYRGTGARAISIVVGFVLQLGLGMVFATIGGVLGAMLFRKAPPLAPPPPPGSWTPPPPPPPAPGSLPPAGGEPPGSAA